MNKEKESKHFGESEEKRASELSELLKNEREWLRTCVDSEAALIIASLELPVKVIRLESKRKEALGQYEDLNDSAVAEREDRNPRFKLQLSQLSLMRTLHGHRNDLAKTVKFVGWPGIHVSLEDEKEEIIELLEEIDCIPVFPPETEFEIFNEFCHIYLWSLFHNILNADELNNTPFNHEQWRVYHQMNLLWSSIITPMVSPDNMDMVWINDYHLLLLCQYMNRKVKGINIGLFLHIPFPSYEIFRCLPVREELLRSMLMADLIGFHFFPYAKQFLSSCRRLLGVCHYFKPGGLIGIDKNSSNGEQKSDFYYRNNPNEQETIVRIGHVHIQCDDILQAILSNKEIRMKALDIRERYVNHFVFVSIDRLDQLSGLQLKLRAFDLFLQNYPYIKNKQPVVLIQYIFPTNTLTFEKREKLIQSLISLTNEINLKHSSESLNKFNLRRKNETKSFSGCDNSSNVPSNGSGCGLLTFKNPVVELKYGPITQEEKYALFLSGDCLFDTSVREGLNVNPFEYITCKDESLRILNQHQFLNGTQQNPLGSSSFRTCTSFSPYSSSFSSHSNSSSNSNSSEQGESSGNDEYSRKKSLNSSKIVMGPYCTFKSHKPLPRLIISEFTGCSNTLSSPYRVNPWNLMNMVETLDRVVSSIKCISNEKKHHWKMDRAYLLSHSTVNWAKEFIMDLRVFSKKKRNDTLYHTTYGIGPSLKGISINLNSKQFNLNSLIHTYKKISKKSLRVFLLDNEGTLTPDYKFLFDNSSQNKSNCGFLNEDRNEAKADSKTEICRSSQFALNKNSFNLPKPLENNGSIKDGFSSNKDLILKNIKDLSIEIPRHYDNPNIIGDDGGNGLIEDILTHDISCSPPVEVKEALKKLCSSENNLVIVFSGKNKQLLDDWFGDIENIGLCAEHGYYLKLPRIIDGDTPNTWKKLKINHDKDTKNCINGGLSNSFNDANKHSSDYNSISYANESEQSDPENNDHSLSLIIEDPNSNSDEYQSNDYDVNSNVSLKHHKLNPMDWKNITLQLMEQYVLRTQGSYIENKGTAIIFQYKFCEPYFGSWQAKELYNYLVELLVKYPVNIITGFDFVEVRLNGINKGVAVKYILDEIALNKQSNIEMILCIGDDRTDEDMFSVVNQYSSRAKGSQTLINGQSHCKDLDNSTHEDNIFTVVIGKHNSIANHFLHSTEEVSYIIQTLSLYT
ncbi:trehalose-6-phosphate synthase domain-containing protein [Cryptosporidium ryanae]|uniref:trehalose-6-phosphate synthase domain-containing protein n=1 Tax=Cryptosporidium ryanae TaxID=515981 RepID=UPI00351A7EA2|nr:trehalose-6-phosphate synthase domain-containing protein [Cryptosporidium ryanae]